MQATDNPEIQKFIKMFKTTQQKQLFELMCKEPGADIDRIIQAFWYALAHRNLNKHYGLQMGAKNAKQAALIESQNTRNLSAEEKDLVTDALLIQSAFALNKNTTEQFLRIKNRFRSPNAQPESQEKTVVAEQPIQSVEEKTEESVKDSHLKEVNDTYTDDQIYTDPDLEGVDASASPEGKEKTIEQAIEPMQSEAQNNTAVPSEPLADNTSILSQDAPINDRPMILKNVLYQTLETLDEKHDIGELKSILEEIEINRQDNETAEEFTARENLLKKVKEAYTKLAEVRAKGYDTLSPEYKAVKDQYVTGKLDNLIATEALANFTQIFDGALGTMDDGVNRDRAKEMLVPNPNAELKEFNIQSLSTLNDKFRNIGELLPRLKEDVAVKTPQEQEVLNKIISAYEHLRGLSWGSEEYKLAKSKYVDGLDNLIINEDLAKFTQQFDGALGVMDDGVYRDKKIKVWVISGQKNAHQKTPSEKTLADIARETVQQFEQHEQEAIEAIKKKKELPRQNQQEATPVIVPSEAKKTDAETEEEISDTPEQSEPQVPVEPAKEEIKESEKSSKKWLGMIGLVGLLGLGGLFGLKSDKNQQSDKGDLDRETLNQPKMVQQEKANKQSVIKIEGRAAVIQTIGSTQIWGMAPSGNQVTPENKTQVNDSTNNQASVVSAVKDAANGSIDVVKKAVNRTIDAGEDLLHGRIASSVRNLTDVPTGAVQDVTNAAFDAVKNTGDVAQKAQSDLKNLLSTNSQVEDASLGKTVETAVNGIVVNPLTNLGKGTGNILTGEFKEGFTQLGEGVIGPIGGTVETVSEAVKTVLKAGDSILDVFFGSEINSEKSNQNSVAVQMYNKGQNNK